MSARPTTTLIVRTKLWVARADTFGASEPRVRFWYMPPATRADAIAMVLGEGGQPARRVWVLDSEVWVGQVELSAGAVAGLSDAELCEPAAYEAEVASELPPAETATSVRRYRIPESDDQFLVVQAPNTHVAQLGRQLAGFGSKLAGLGHPAGLPAARRLMDEPPGEGEERDDWRRVEFWNGEVVLVERESGRFRVIATGVPPTSNWRPILQHHLLDSPHAILEQTLVEPGVSVRDGARWRAGGAAQGSARWLNIGEEQSDGESVVSVELDDKAIAERFVAQWADALAGADAARAPLPMLTPPKAPAKRWPQWVMGVAALLIVALVIWAQHTHQQQTIDDLQGRVSTAKEGFTKLADLKREASGLDQQVRKNTEEVQKLEASLAAQQKPTAEGPSDLRPAIAAMFDALAETASDRSLVESIDNGSPNHRITGIALSADEASRLAQRLSRELQGVWHVTPAKIEPVSRGGAVGWRFDITLDPVVTAVEEQP